VAAAAAVPAAAPVLRAIPTSRLVPLLQGRVAHLLAAESLSLHLGSRQANVSL